MKTKYHLFHYAFSRLEDASINVRICLLVARAFLEVLVDIRNVLVYNSGITDEDYLDKLDRIGRE